MAFSTQVAQRQPQARLVAADPEGSGHGAFVGPAAVDGRGVRHCVSSTPAIASPCSRARAAGPPASPAGPAAAIPREAVGGSAAASSSSTSASCRRALRSITSSPRSTCCGGTLRRVRSSSVQPRIALSGVRSSCETVARNSSFTRRGSAGGGRAVGSRPRSRRRCRRRAGRAAPSAPTSAPAIAGAVGLGGPAGAARRRARRRRHTSRPPGPHQRVDTRTANRRTQQPAVVQRHPDREQSRRRGQSQRCPETALRGMCRHPSIPGRDPLRQSRPPSLRGTDRRPGARASTSSCGGIGLARCSANPARAVRAPLLRAGVGGHRDRRHGAPGATAAANRRQQPVAVGHRHGDVGQHDVGPPMLEDLDGLGGRRGDARLGAGRAEDVAEQLAPVGLVVDGEDADAAAAACRRPPAAASAGPASALVRRANAGSVTVNVAPRPGPSLCAVIRPPCPTTMIRASAQPEPERRLIPRRGARAAGGTARRRAAGRRGRCRRRYR